MLNVLLLNFYMASSTTNFILFLVCTAIQNISWMDRFINAYVIIIIIIADIVRKHGLSLHLYADDTQIYIMFNQDDTVNAISRTEACVAEIKSWMITNKLMLNGDKTVIIVFSAPRFL